MSAARNVAPSTVEERIARAIAAIRADLEPDPLFERRLRTQVLNRYVAAREGAVAPAAAGARNARREMGRLGRAVLYASFVLGVSVTSVVAASQQAVPGDVLYPLKRDIEALRHRVLPAEFEALLLRTELTARLDELADVADRGDSAAVASLAAEVHRSYGEVIELTADSPQNLLVLDALLDRLPSPARAALADVVLDVDRAAHPVPARPSHAAGTRDAKPGASPAGGRGATPPGPGSSAPPGDASPPASSAPGDVPAASSGGPGPTPHGKSSEGSPAADPGAEGESPGPDGDE